MSTIRGGGAFALFVATGVVLFALQMLNGMLSDLVAWPKNIHLGLLFALWVNVGVAMVVSLFRRRFGRAAVGARVTVVKGLFGRLRSQAARWKASIN